MILSGSFSGSMRCISNSLIFSLKIHVIKPVTCLYDFNRSVSAEGNEITLLIFPEIEDLVVSPPEVEKDQIFKTRTKVVGKQGGCFSNESGICGENLFRVHCM